MTLTDHLPLLSGRKLASSTSSTQSSCTWRRRPPSTCSRASTCPTRMPASAWAASAWRVTPTPYRSANSLVPGARAGVPVLSLHTCRLSLEAGGKRNWDLGDLTACARAHTHTHTHIQGLPGEMSGGERCGGSPFPLLYRWAESPSCVCRAGLSGA